ncbi:MAG: rod shape-determining protein MreD [Candidatus Omnitrophota bacterium]
MNNTLSSGIIEAPRPLVLPKILMVCALLLLAILQSTVIDRIGIFNIEPDLLLIAVVIVALSSSWKWALFFGFTAGFCKDIFGSSAFGIYTLILSTLGFLCFELSKSLMIETRLRLLITVSLAVAFEYLALALFLASSGDPVPFGIFLRSVLIGSAYSAAFSPLVLKLFQLIGK